MARLPVSNSTARRKKNQRKNAAATAAHQHQHQWRRRMMLCLGGMMLVLVLVWVQMMGDSGSGSSEFNLDSVVQKVQVQKELPPNHHHNNKTIAIADDGTSSTSSLPTPPVATNSSTTVADSGSGLRGSKQEQDATADDDHNVTVVLPNPAGSLDIECKQTQWLGKAKTDTACYHRVIANQNCGKRYMTYNTRKQGCACYPINMAMCTLRSARGCISWDLTISKEYLLTKNQHSSTVTKKKKNPTMKINNNPYEGWQPNIHTDAEEEGDVVEGSAQCHTWRTCFTDPQQCPGKCREGPEDFGTAPPRPQEAWIPDVTVLRRMMLAGKDAMGNPWPPPLVDTTTDTTTKEEEYGRELCDPIGVLGGGTHKEKIGPKWLCRPVEERTAINAIPIRGRPLVPPTPNKSEKQKQPSILCMVYTMAQNHHTSIRAIRETWAGGCDGFLAFSTQDDPRIPAISLPHEGPEDYKNMWQKVRSIWRFVGTHYLDDFDFFFQGGEDLYVLPQNLRNYLASAIEDPTTEDFFGGRRFQIPHGAAFNSGGAGYALSQATLRKLHDVGLDHPKCTPHAHTSTEDVQIAQCLKKVFDIGIVDTRDEQERERFHHFSPGAHYTWTPPSKGHQDWYERYNRLWPNKLREQCCAPDSVSFHYIKKPAMVRHIHSLFYLCDDSTSTVHYNETK